jgi:hypothetical protein
MEASPLPRIGIDEKAFKKGIRIYLFPGPLSFAA